MKAYKKDIYRSILKSKNRFITILFIVLFGTVCYVGINTAIYSIKKTVSNRLIENNMYDIKIEVLAGFTQKDIDLITKQKNIEYIRFYREYVDSSKKTLYIESDKINNEKDAINLINTENNKINFKYNIIGNDYDMSYIQKDINKFGINIERAYLIKNTDELRNVAVIKLKETKNLTVFDEKYLDIVNSYKEKLQKELSIRPEARKIEILNDIEHGITELKDGINKIDENEKSISDAELEIQINEEKLQEEKENFFLANTKFEKAKKELENARQEINTKKLELNENYVKVNNGLSEINKNYNTLIEGLEKINAEEKKLLENENKLKSSLNLLSDEKIKEYNSQIEQAKIKIKEERKKINTVLDNKKILENNKKQIENAFLEIENAEKKIENSAKDIENKIYEYNTNYDKNLLKIKEAEKKIQISKSQLKQGKTDVEINKILLNSKIDELNSKKTSIETPIYNIENIYDNVAFKTFYVNIQVAEVMSVFFTIIFFATVVFILSTTMLRFINEEKNNIAIYKFLGYKDITIIQKYIIYSLVPAILAMIIACIIAIKIIPQLIYPAYKLELINIFDKLDIHINTNYIIIVFITIILTIILTISIIYNIGTKNSIASLMLDKENIKSKKIFLEKLSIWNNLKFSNKILVRNIFKYKSRLIMTVVGVSLCTALVYIGISLNFSINNITNKQYNIVQKYDKIVYFKYDTSLDNKEKYIKDIDDIAYTYKINVDQVKIKKNKFYYDLIHINLLDNKNINDFFNFDIKDNQIAISQKTFDIVASENLDIIDKYNNINTIKYDKVFENYINQYIITKNTKTNDFNAILVKFKSNIDEANKNLNINDDIFNISSKDENKVFFENKLKSISSIVILMISMGAILSMIVTYNITNLNIMERKRELSTLEVLGYSYKKRIKYVFTEIIILSALSSILGLLLGRILQLFIAKQLIYSSIQLVIELNYKALAISYLISMLFVIIVLILFSKKIKNIDMIESLKSGE